MSIRNTIKHLFFILIFPASAFAQIPAGYYDNAMGLYGDDLKLALFNIIKNHNTQSYNNLWNLFGQTDKQPNSNYIWDIYSDNPNGNNPYNFVYNSDKCGNYSGEGDCYNREHSMPKSWFNDIAPMNSDLFHVYPVDGYVNGKRSNNAYGTVGNATWTSQNGSKLGYCNYPGYSSTQNNAKVFEPIDEYKGDVARSYFYMLTRYQNVCSTWSSDMLSGNGFSTWAENMLVEWATNDPVSQKEIDRNNAIYQIQGNRNPYIDHPEWTVRVWGPTASIERNHETVLISSRYANGILTLTSTINKPTLVAVYNLLGEKLLKTTIQQTQQNIQIDLPKGIYLITATGKRSNAVKFAVQ